jgi:hypothetical protein
VDLIDEAGRFTSQAWRSLHGGDVRSPVLHERERGSVSAGRRQLGAGGSAAKCS